MYNRFKKKDKGQGLVEYALILVLVAIVVIAALMILGPIIGNVFSDINSSLTGVGAGGGGVAAPAPTEPPAPTEDPQCAVLLANYQAAHAAYCGNQSQCWSAYQNVVNAYNAYYGAGCGG